MARRVRPSGSRRKIVPWNWWLITWWATSGMYWSSAARTAPAIVLTSPLSTVPCGRLQVSTLQNISVRSDSEFVMPTTWSSPIVQYGNFAVSIEPDVSSGTVSNTAGVPPNAVAMSALAIRAA